MHYQRVLPLINHEVNKSLVHQRSEDGYVNATALCIAAGQLVHRYQMDPARGKFIRALSTKTEIAVDVLVQTIIDENNNAAVWVHPKVAINIAQWLSPEFEAQVSEWVFQYLTGRAQKPVELPVHFKRYQANDGKVPNGYFSILQETTLGLTVPLHYSGFEIPKNWAPDISVGLLFCKWLRKEKGVDTTLLPTYHHDWQDSRGVQKAKLYPDMYLADCRLWFRTIWLPIHGAKYFQQKDPSSLQYFDKLPSLSNSTVPQFPR